MISLLTNEHLVASIDNDQVVLTNQNLTEATHHPAQEALAWHRSEVFKY